jgi:hypothetical protein
MKQTIILGTFILLGIFILICLLEDAGSFSSDPTIGRAPMSGSAVTKRVPVFN